MSKKRFKPYTPGQTKLLLVTLPDQHVGAFILDLVSKLDLSQFYESYTGAAGQPPFAPNMMIAVWMLGYTYGIRSSRKLERACTENLPFRFVAGDQVPDFWTLSDFRRRHAAAHCAFGIKVSYGFHQ